MMGLSPQPNTWQCGPFALKHALIMLGKIVNERDVSRIAGTHWCAGTDEVKLARAARAYNCDLRLIRHTNPLHARRELLRALKKRYPVLLCIQGWSHWVTVVGAERGKFILIDSHDAPVVCIDSWKSLKKKWVFREKSVERPGETDTLYDLHPLIPRFRARTKANFSLERARYLRRPENRTFARHWDEYFTDLSFICIPRSSRTTRIIPFGEFLRRHSAMIRAQIPFWHGTVPTRLVDRILRHLLIVADTYDFVIRQEDEKRALVAIATNLGLWSAGKYGVNPVYGNE